jgi:hypothetical protein
MVKILKLEMLFGNVTLKNKIKKKKTPFFLLSKSSWKEQY